MRSLTTLIILAVLTHCEMPIEPLEEVPKSIPSFEVWSDGTEAFNGYIQLRKFTDPGAQLIIDSDGAVVWYGLADTAIFRPFTPLHDRYLSLHDDKTIYEVTYAGDTTLALVFDDLGFDRTLHHEVIYDGDNIAALTKEKLVLDSDSLASTKDNIIVTDGILVLNKNGDKVWHWTIDDVLDPKEDPEILKSMSDWGHANSLALDNDGNYLISWRNFNEVWKIDRSNGELIWRYGPNQVKDSSEMFYGQHSLHVGRDGQYLLIDNGHKKYRNSSRALGFSYDVNAGFEQTKSITLPDSLFTSKMGSVYQIDEERYLFCSPMSKSLAITDASGKIVWYAKSGFQYYRAYYMDRVIL